MPRFVNDLYADLRDRRMLLPVAVLIVAILAVPVLMKSEAPPPPPPAADAELTGEDLSTVPAVLTSDPELRDYRERLEKLSSKNPFRERFAAEAASGSGIPDIDVIGGSTGSSVQLPAGSGAGAGFTEPSQISEPTSPVPEPTSSVPKPTSSSSEPAVETASATSKPTKERVRTKRVPVVHRADLRVGPAGDLDRRRNVKMLTVLPGKSEPVLVFVGATEDSKEAVFMVSSGVEGAEGTGSCLPSTEDCQFLTLKAEESMELHYGGGEAREIYVIRLLELRLEPLKTKKQNSDDEKSSSVEDDLAAWLGI